ncbi:Protein SPT2 -like protein [Halotydeus destructor]|nr:Protein SPT2 -like protein [Halotydeus destructor]
MQGSQRQRSVSDRIPRQEPRTTASGGRPGLTQPTRQGGNPPKPSSRVLEASKTTQSDIKRLPTIEKTKEPEKIEKEPKLTAAERRKLAEQHIMEEKRRKLMEEEKRIRLRDIAVSSKGRPVDSSKITKRPEPSRLSQPSSSVGSRPDDRRREDVRPSSNGVRQASSQSSLNSSQIGASSKTLKSSEVQKKTYPTVGKSSLSDGRKEPDKAKAEPKLTAAERRKIAEQHIIEERKKKIRAEEERIRLRDQALAGRGRTDNPPNVLRKPEPERRPAQPQGARSESDKVRREQSRPSPSGAGRPTSQKPANGKTNGALPNLPGRPVVAARNSSPAVSKPPSADKKKENEKAKKEPKLSAAERRKLAEQHLFEEKKRRLKEENERIRLRNAALSGRGRTEDLQNFMKRPEPNRRPTQGTQGVRLDADRSRRDEPRSSTGGGGMVMSQTIENKASQSRPVARPPMPPPRPKPMHLNPYMDLDVKPRTVHKNPYMNDFDVRRREIAARRVAPSTNKMARGGSYSQNYFDEDEEEDEDDEMNDFIDDGGDFEAQKEEISDYIREIFGYDKRKYLDMDDDDIEEASFAQQAAEEMYSARVGLKEDLEDIAMEEREKKMKAIRMKKARIMIHDSDED